jgi:NADP-dependent 3-hydroxy acid dehydrogenase YdfG
MTEYSGIKGRRALVTGATSGLRFAMAKTLVSEGARVFATGRNLEKVNRAVAELQPLAGTCHGCVIDVRDEQSIQFRLS